MTNQKPETAAVALSPAKRIDQISSVAMAAFYSAESFEKELEVAKSLNDLREALTPEIMGDVMKLMNTPLGFDTDRNPAKVQAGKPIPAPYSVAEVKECFIEARLRGFHCINNEFNIIAGRFYGTVNGFERLVRKNPKVFDLQETFEVPRFNSDRTGAIVEAKATWNQLAYDQPENADKAGKRLVAQTLTRQFVIRVNANMGADAVFGKAKRKLFAAIYSRLSGVITADSEPDESAPTVTNGAATPANNLFTKPVTATAATEVEPAKEKAEAKSEPAPANKPEVVEETPQQQLGRFLTESGVKFDDFRDFVITKGLLKDADKYGSYEELPAAFVSMFRTSHVKSQAELIRKFGTLQQVRDAAK